MKKLLFLLPLVFFSCIGDDFVDDGLEPVLRITTMVESIQKGEQYQFEALYLNAIGQEENVELLWESSNTSLLLIDSDGLATALEEGEVTVTVSVMETSVPLSSSFSFSVSSETIVSEVLRTGTIMVTSNYTLRGNFSMSEEQGNLKLSIDDTYLASSNLPGLYIYLTNNPSSTAGAYEIGAVNVFSGAHQYIIDGGVEINDYDYLLYYCKPFNVKIGEGRFIN